MRPLIFFICLLFLIVELLIENYWLRLDIPFDFKIWHKITFGILFVLLQVPVITFFVLLVGKKTFPEMLKGIKIVIAICSALVKTVFMIILYFNTFGMLGPGLMDRSKEPAKTYVYDDQHIHIYIEKEAASWQQEESRHPLLDLFSFKRPNYFPTSTLTIISYANSNWPEKHELGSLLTEGFQYNVLEDGEPKRAGDSLFLHVISAYGADTSIFAIDLEDPKGKWIKTPGNSVFESK